MPRLVHHLPSLTAYPLLTSCGLEVAAGVLVTPEWAAVTCERCLAKRNDENEIT